MSSTSFTPLLQPLQVYKLARTLGEGAFAKVKLVKHLPSAEFVAMKEISKASLTTPTNYERFIREITFFKTLAHPNVISLYEVIESSSHYYFVMPYADNADLLTYITEQRCLKESTVRGIFTQVVQGVAYLHKQHVAHRDLKPENVLLMNNYTKAIISDFGLANWCGDKKLRTVCGSLHYASPEMIMGETYSGEESDVWSLGVLLYVMVTGRLPFYGSNSDEVCNRIVNVVYKFPGDAKVSKQCKDLITKMLVHDPQQRIKLHAVMTHPFVDGDSNDGQRCDAGDVCDEDKAIADTVDALGKYGIDATKEEIKKKISENVFDQVTTCYKLIKEKHIKRIKHTHSNDKGINCASYRPKVKCKVLSPRTDGTGHNGVLKMPDRNKGSYTHAKQSVSSKTKTTSLTSSTFQSKTNIGIANAKHKDKHYTNNTKLSITPHHHSIDKQRHPFHTTINLSEPPQVQTIFKHKRLSKKTKTTLQKANHTAFTLSYADMNINTSANTDTSTILHLYTSNNPKQKMSLKQQQSTSSTFNSHDIRSVSHKKTSLNKTKQPHTPRKRLFTFSNMKSLSISKPTPHQQPLQRVSSTAPTIFMICTTHHPISAVKHKLEMIAVTNHYTLTPSKPNVYQLVSDVGAVLDVHVDVSGILKMCHRRGEKRRTKEMVRAILDEIGFD